MSARPTLLFYWPTYLDVGRDAIQRGTAILAQKSGPANPEAATRQFFVGVIMPALAAEAFINELAEFADYIATGPDTALLTDVAVTLKELEDAHATAQLKYQVAAKILSGRTFPKDRAPFQDFDKLMRLRNLLVHLKPSEPRYIPTGSAPSNKFVRDFDKRDLTNKREWSWLHRLASAGMAAWSHDSALAIIHAIGAMLPSGLSPAVDGFKQTIADFQLLTPAGSKQAAKRNM